MSDPYLGEIRSFGFNFAPVNWAFCNGTILSIQQYSALFSLLGTNYGGNGTTNFGLPNFQNVAPMHWGAGPGLTPRDIGEVLGSAGVTLQTTELPSHTHQFMAATAGDPSQDVPAPTNQAQLSAANPGQLYSTVTTPAVAFSPKAIGLSGGSQPHNNVQPLLALNFCISTAGTFPPRG